MPNGARTRPGTTEPPSPTSPGRRRLLRRAALAATLVTGPSLGGCLTASERSPDERSRRHFILHGSTHWETHPASLSDTPITPHERLYVCNHLPFPARGFVADRSGWKLEVDGTRQTTVLSVAQLRSLGEESLTMVLQCAGNGRRFFDHRPRGPGWGIGAVGCVTWTGVPLRRLVAALGGVGRGARYATATGGEPLNPFLDRLVSMRVERSIPLEKVLDDCLLAWTMNDVPIPLVHGGPLRLIVPGYFGINQIKYLRKLSFTDKESDSSVMRRLYRYRPLGAGPAPTQPTTWAMGPKSWIWPPRDVAQPRSASLRGVAFGGLDALERVEITVDEGRSWRAVPVTGPDLGRYAWRAFEFRLDLPRGAYRVASRAIDIAGRRQPRRRTPNAGGYGNASWSDHAVRVELV